MNIWHKIMTMKINIMSMILIIKKTKINIMTSVIYLMLLRLQTLTKIKIQKKKIMLINL